MKLDEAVPELFVQVFLHRYHWPLGILTMAARKTVMVDSGANFVSGIHTPLPRWCLEREGSSD